MKGASDRDRFLRRVEDAAAQYWLMRHWDSDLGIASTGVRTCYAVDADIIVTYSNPELTARRAGNRWGYSEVFRDDPLEYSVSLGRRLADYIFFQLQPNQAPLIVVPPIDSEVVSIVNALASQLGDTPPEPHLNLEALTEWEERASEVLIDQNPKEVESLLESLAGIFQIGSSVDQNRFFKIAYLLGERRIVPSHSIEARDRLPAEIEEVLSAPLSIQNMFDLASSTEEWRDQITSVSDAAGRKDRLAADAAALARLEIWNKQLAPKKWRIVYITGARHVIEAIEARPNDNAEALVKVRHPRHFLASPNVVSFDRRRDAAKKTNSHSDFFDLIRTFLSDCSVDPGDRMHLTQFARVAAETAFDDHPEIGDEFEASWNAYLGALEIDRPEYSRFKEKFVQAASTEVGGKKILTRAYNYRSTALRVVDEMLDDAWEQCFRAAVEAGFFIGRRARERFVDSARLVPPIIFDSSWPDTNRFVDIMGKRNGPERLRAEYDTWLEKIKLEVGGRAYPYAYYLAHAALFAGRGEWKVASIVARRALKKAVPVKDAEKTDLAHGREAAYLSAYCLRHSYRNISDLAEASELLSIARRIHEEENEHNPEQDILPERFDAEELALAMTKLLHEWFGVEEKHDLERARELKEGCVSLFQKLDPFSKEISVKTEMLLKRIAANIVVLSALVRDYGADFELASAYFARGPAESRYLNAISLFCRAVKNPRAELGKVNEAFVSPSLMVLPYDDKRFRYLASEIIRLSSIK